MDQNSQLITYIQTNRSYGVDDATTKNQLMQSGWQEATIAAALQTPTQLRPHRIRNGVIWILSPFIVLIFVAIMQVLSSATGLSSLIVNIISLLGGMAGIILLAVGPVMGIITLTRK